ncbi:MULTISPECIES: universal stress protein [Desulfococcus]|uniref:UspA domain-containing protein n=1 Tax=Desulfococcus multivorans DSM 2059 TaxID=1121405 RepID=S7U2Q2_DESML|nr:universal stress protein [Desulfococcus multivorans]AOY58457.1 putative UspA domain protein [Desulfococcus multivorans]EPR43245.1 UspA domain-containing protein [Desulfococcus multivorans DSM 2059]SJZ40980.1 Nucleotide-binding universal stress protein, UspA family [Desulfococcus multivorans DSM 2059]
MNKGQSVLFGIDDSDFARQALSEIGGLLKKNENLKITVFHGVAEPDFSAFLESIGEEPRALEKYRERWDLKARTVLEQAEEVLAESGFDPGKTSTVLDKKCGDPADAMLKAADNEGIETIAVSRWGKSTISRKLIGSVTYRLVQSADDLALWVIDPRICSNNVLIGLVGAPISQRVVDYTVRYFSHLKESKFTFFHVIPPIPPQYWSSEDIKDMEEDEKHEKIARWLKEYTDKVKATADDAKQKLVAAGVPERNVVFRFQPQQKGIARDILLELEQGNHGILVIGRRGYKDIREFGLGSKANKVLLSGRAFVICLVN